MSVNSALLSLVPAGTTHCTVEERQHRGEPVYAVMAIVPDGPSIPLNGYSSKTLAESTTEEINAHLTTCASDNCTNQHDSRRLVDESGRLIGYICDTCYHDAETEESLDILSMERIAYG